MFSRCLSSVLMLATACLAVTAADLRVCADPDNMPFSNRDGQGFDNRIAALIAKDLGRELQYVWQTQRSSSFSDSLDANLCDFAMGVPAGAAGPILTTHPYYGSSYVFVSLARGAGITSLLDPKLETMRIGLPILGDDYAPPAYLLAARGLSSRLAGYPLKPPASLLGAVERGQVDIAILWGPVAEYFAKRSEASFAIAPVSPPAYMAIPFRYDISAAVRHGNTELQSRIDAALASGCDEIASILSDYGAPVLPGGETKCAVSHAASVSSR